MNFKRKRPEGLYFHCVNCHADLVEGQFTRQPTGYDKVDGKLVPSTTRFGVTCNQCAMFLCHVDLTPAPVRKR